MTLSTSTSTDTGTTDTGTTDTGTTDRRRRAYAAGASMARERIAREAPLDAEALRRVQASDVVLVRGAYDHVEWVLESLEMPFTAMEPHEVGQVRFRPEQLLVVNCPGHIGGRGVDAVREFVTRGGSLFTTDWALLHVLQPAFPGVVEHNGVNTADDVVRIQVLEGDNPFLRGVMDGQDDPQWWLEGASYPIRVLDRDRVQVLLTSRDLANRYGEAPVAVTFEHGKGEVFHMISHYYLQRTDLRTKRHAMPAGEYAMEKGVAMPAMAEDLSLGEVESAHTSARLFANVVARKKRRQEEGASRFARRAGSRLSPGATPFRSRARSWGPTPR